MGSQRTAAIERLFRHVENAIPGARIGNTAEEPVLWLPAPEGYAVWIFYQYRKYTACISKRTDPVEIWHKEVGRKSNSAGEVWDSAASWFNQHPTLNHAYQLETTALAASTAPADYAQRAPNEAQPMEVPTASQGTLGLNQSIASSEHYNILESAYQLVHDYSHRQIDCGIIGNDTENALCIRVTTVGYMLFHINVSGNISAALVSGDYRISEGLTKGEDLEIAADDPSIFAIASLVFTELTLERLRADEDLPLRLRADAEEELATFTAVRHLMVSKEMQ